MLADGDTNNNGDYSQDNQGNEEANPALLACCTGAIDSLIRISQTIVEARKKPVSEGHTKNSPSLSVLFDRHCSALNIFDLLVLLFNKDAHLSVRISVSGMITSENE